MTASFLDPSSVVDSIETDQSTVKGCGLSTYLPWFYFLCSQVFIIVATMLLGGQKRQEVVVGAVQTVVIFRVWSPDQP